MRKLNNLYSSVLTLSLMASAAWSVGQGTIHSVDVQRSALGIDVVVKGERLSAPTVTRTNRGAVYIASFRGTIKGKAGREAVNAFGINTVQWVQYTVRPQVARVVLRLKPETQPAVTPVEGGFNISVGQAGTAQESPTTPVSTRTSVTRLPSVGETTTTATTTTPTQPTPGERRVLSAAAERPMNPLVAEVLPSQSGRTISLEFDDAEVTQVLKALAMQANVNVVTSPEVKGTLTIKLDKVSVEHALNVITAMAGLRYQQVDKTIVVAPPERLVEILRGINAKETTIDATTETRIVPVFSRQARQVKAAAYRMVPQTMRSGRYEIVLPSEDATDGATIPAAAPAAGNAPAPPAPAASASNASKPDEYVMIIGSRSRLDEVEKVIRELDAQLCGALGIEFPTSSAVVQMTYNVKGTTAKNLLDAVGAKDGSINGVTVAATPPTSNSPQAIVLSGREHEVRRVMSALSMLDSEGAANDEFVVYDVAYSEPRALRDEIIIQVPGIRASIAPASVGNPRLYNTRGASMQVGGSTSTDLASKASTETSGAGGGAANPTDGTVGGSSGFQGGLGQPFKEMEPVAQPMRIVLRGTESQIKRAQDILAKLDLPPRMVALEVRVMELSKDDAVNIGLDWNIFTGGAVKFIRLRNTVETPSNSIGVGINDNNFTGDVVGTLDKLANKNNLIARPNMIAPDGRESELFIGDAIRYVETITASQNGPSVQIGTVRVGINLSVLPRISADGTMTLDLRPIVSFLTGFKRVSVQGFAAELPQTSERITQQTISLRSGETFAISGLIQSQDVKQMSGVPILMDLPIIGALFRRTTTQTVRRELVVFVTAKSINGPLTTSNSEMPFNRDSEAVKKSGGN